MLYYFVELGEMMIKNTKKTQQFTGGDTRPSSSHPIEVASRTLKSEVK